MTILRSVTARNWTSSCETRSGCSPTPLQTSAHRNKSSRFIRCPQLSGCFVSLLEMGLFLILCVASCLFVASLPSPVLQHWLGFISPFNFLLPSLSPVLLSPSSSPPSFTLFLSSVFFSAFSPAVFFPFTLMHPSLLTSLTSPSLASPLAYLPRWPWEICALLSVFVFSGVFPENNVRSHGPGLADGQWEWRKQALWF